MRRLAIVFACLVALTMLGFAGIGETLAYNNYHFVVTPGDLADGPTFDNGRGGKRFGYDPDSVKPLAVNQAGPTGFGDSCFWADVQGSAAGGGVDYTAIRLSPRDIFGVSDVTISDLSEISYYTKWVSDLDWQLKIYTEGEEAGDWYGYRFNFTRPNFGDNAWNQSSTLASGNLRVSDIATKTTGGSTTVPGTGLLTDLDTGFGDKNILFMDIISSYMTNSPPGDSYLDGIRIELDNGDTATMDLATPEPASLIAWSLIGATAAGLSVWRRRRRGATRMPWSAENRQAIREIVDGRRNG